MSELKRFFRPGPGTEARTARSAYGVRLLLSALMLPIGVAAGGWFLQAAGGGRWDTTGMRIAGVICIAVALVAAIDIAVILRKRTTGGR